VLPVRVRRALQGQDGEDLVIVTPLKFLVVVLLALVVIGCAILGTLFDDMKEP
jgi:hypothetical protein